MLLVALSSSAALAQSLYREIVLAQNAHPAAHSAAQIIARKLSIAASAVRTVGRVALPRRGQIVLAYAPASAAQKKLLGTKPESVKHDGYVIAFHNGGALIYGARPRALLYAAGDVHLWRNETFATFVRDPDFALRTGQYDSNRSVAEYVAALGVNLIIMRRTENAVTLKEMLPDVYRQFSPEEQARLDRTRGEHRKQNLEFVKECHDADVPVYAFLYGNDFSAWSPVLYQAVIKTFPSAKGTPVPRAFEKNALSPADPLTWRAVRAYIQDFMDLTGADGLYATFWDRYGIYCRDDACRQAGLQEFRDQLYESVKQYYAALPDRQKKLVVRTWASGSSHWLRDEFVHAPGYGNFSGNGEDVWGRVIHDLPADIVLQTKVYDSDCEPDGRFNPLIGRAKPHPEIVEYQVSGQFVGRFYFPASSVNYMARTMRQAYELVGPEGGVNIFPGGTMQANYSVFDDILNSINLYAWRELSWNTHADVEKIWRDWALPIYGEHAAPLMIKVLQLSEPVVDRTFSTLGLGSSTNSDFAGNIARRETLLRYTNRYYLPEYAQYLEPTKENIQRVVEEKEQTLLRVDEMFAAFEQARPLLTPAQAGEVATRLDWLREFAIVNSRLDESLWRFRYLRYLDSMLTTDPQQLKFLAEAYDAVQQHAPRLFHYDPAQKFSCYSTTLGELRTQPALGSPLPLMRELYTKSKELIETTVGPDFLPGEWRR